MLNKKGISSILGILFLIVIVIIATGIVWAVVGNVISEESSKISLGPSTINLDLKNALVDFSLNQVTVIVKRDSGKGELTHIKFIVSDGKNSENFEESTNLNELGTETFILELNELNPLDIIDISVYPVIKSEKNTFVGESGDSIVPIGLECVSETCDEIHSCIENYCELNTSGMISWWKLNGDELDEIGNNDGLNNGTILIEEGKYNQAYLFDGNHIEISNNTDFSNLDIEFSVIAWANPNSWDANHNTIVGQESGFLLAIDSSGNLANWINTGGSWTKDTSSNPLILLDNWTHFAMTYDGVKIKSYVNGVLQGNGQSKSGIMATTNKVYIGKRDGLNFQPFHGVIDEVMIFNSVLSDEEVEALYLADLS